MARKAAEFVQFKLRVSEKLRRDLEREAKKNHRSANAEAAERLERSFKADATGHWESFMTMLIGGGRNTALLHWLALKMGKDWNWSDSAESRQRMVEEIKSELEARSAADRRDQEAASEITTTRAIERTPYDDRAAREPAITQKSPVVDRA
jgi:hypothetical protein